MPQKPNTPEEKEIRKLKRTIHDLRGENRRMKKALKNNNLYVDGSEKLEKRCTPRNNSVQPKKEMVKQNKSFNKDDFLENIKKQRKVDGTWDINKEE